MDRPSVLSHILVTNF